MFCAHCGVPNLETEPTCRQCHEPLVSPSGFLPVQADAPRRSRPRWPVRLIAVAVVLGALAVVADPGCRLNAQACRPSTSKPGSASASVPAPSASAPFLHRVRAGA